MKIDASVVLMFLRLILCDAKILTWLESEAAKTTTPIDDTAVKGIKYLLCPETESK